MSDQYQIRLHELLGEFQQAIIAQTEAENNLQQAVQQLYETVELLYHRNYLPVVYEGEIPAIAFLRLTLRWMGFPYYPSHPEFFQNPLPRHQIVDICDGHGISLWSPDAGGALVPTTAEEQDWHGEVTALVENYNALIGGHTFDDAKMYAFAVAVRFCRESVIPVCDAADIDSVSILQNYYGWRGLAMYPTAGDLVDEADPVADLRQYAMALPMVILGLE